MFKQLAAGLIAMPGTMPIVAAVAEPTAYSGTTGGKYELYKHSVTRISVTGVVAREK